MIDPPPREGVAFGGFGLVLMGVFTGLWARWGLHERNAITVTLGGALIVFALVLVGNGVHSLRSLDRFPISEDREAYGPVVRRFNLVFGGEVLLIVVVSIVLGAVGLDRLEPSAIALIVGAHFLPMAALFRRRLDLWMGSLTVLIALVGIVVTASHADAASTTNTVVEFCIAAVTATYGAIMLRQKHEAFGSRGPA